MEEDTERGEEMFREGKEIKGASGKGGGKGREKNKRRKMKRRRKGRY